MLDGLRHTDHKTSYRLSASWRLDRRLESAGLLVLGLGLTLPAAASIDVESLRARVEAVRSGDQGPLRGETIAARHLLPAFYESRDFRPAWTDPARTASLLRAIHDAERDGLDPRDYHLRALEPAGAAGEADELDLELLRTDALIRLGYHVLFGKVDPTTLDPDWNYERNIPAFEPVRALEEIVAAPTRPRRSSVRSPPCRSTPASAKRWRATVRS
jgi:murein L,D-transpeptidase YcbB/YkuD